MIRRPPRSTLSSSSAASDVYKRQAQAFFKTGLKPFSSFSSCIFTTCDPMSYALFFVGAFFHIKLTIWDPQQFYVGIHETPCPCCGYRGNVVRKCWKKRPRQVKGLERVEWLLGGLYLCRDCEARHKDLKKQLAAARRAQRPQAFKLLCDLIQCTAGVAAPQKERLLLRVDRQDAGPVSYTHLTLPTKRIV